MSLQISLSQKGIPPPLGWAPTELHACPASSTCTSAHTHLSTCETQFLDSYLSPTPSFSNEYPTNTGEVGEDHRGCFSRKPPGLQHVDVWPWPGWDHRFHERSQCGPTLDWVTSIHTYETEIKANLGSSAPCNSNHSVIPVLHLPGERAQPDLSPVTNSVATLPAPVFSGWKKRSLALP